MPERIIGFEPVAQSDARVLILGSMPSVESLKQSFYYAHPRNAFWRIIAEVFHASCPESIAEKCDLLKGNGIALWDVLASCERQGSLDSAIRGEQLNDFSGLLEACPNIRKVIFNGGAAERLFTRHAAHYLAGKTGVKMPSTSPAYTIPYERKLAQWRQALENIDESM